MHKIDGPGATVDNHFTEGNEASAIPATDVTADIMNALQDEVCNVITMAGFSLVKANNTQLFTAIVALIGTAFLPAGIVSMWAGSIASIPSRWRLCDGTGGTPNLRDRFVVGAGGAYTVGATGGAPSYTTTLGGAHTPTMLASGSHAHTSSVAGAHAHTTDAQGAHSHTLTIDGTTLTLAQMPAHNHATAGGYDKLLRIVSGVGFGSGFTGSVGQEGTITTEGGSGSHTHGGTSNTAGSHAHTTTTTGDHQHVTDAQGSHVHTVNAVGDHAHAVGTLPPYYALAYIMRV